MNIDELIKKIDTLKPVSHIGQRVMQMIYDPESSLDNIVDVIKYDQAMTANLLRICNSSYYGLQNKISSIKQAITFLGTEKVASIVIVGTSADNFKNAQQGYGLDDGELWRYSISSALIAQDIAERKRLKNVPQLFTSALLKDIGKVILNACLEDSFNHINMLVQSKGLSFVEAEREVIGIDHAELGAKIAEKWNFDASMVHIIKNHHDPDQASPDDLSIPIIYLADSICMMIGIGVGSDGLAYRYHEEINEKLNITDVDVQKIIVDFWEKLRSVEELVNLSGGNN